jgi:hypothetical protein
MFVQSLTAANLSIFVSFEEMDWSQALGCSVTETYKKTVVQFFPPSQSLRPQIPILPQAMSSDAENSAPTTGQKRQGALQLGPRKKPFVSMFAIS